MLDSETHTRAVNKLSCPVLGAEEEAWSGLADLVRAKDPRLCMPQKLWLSDPIGFYGAW